MPSSPQSLKKTLVAEGFEVYRTSPNLIILADRVRDNLLMDSGVAVVHGEPLIVRITLRARAAEFPGDGEATLFERARALAEPMKERGYGEVSCASVPVMDPGDPTRTLDTWHEVTYERHLGGEDELHAELRFALSLVKTAER
jgi:hypothetical protein